MVKRGDIYFADLSPVVGSEQGGTRPVLVIQNNLGNHFCRYGRNNDRRAKMVT